MDRYEQNPDFNLYLDGTCAVDEETGDLIVGEAGIRLRPSEALCKVEKRAYDDEFQKWRAEKDLTNRNLWTELITDKKNKQRLVGLVKRVKNRGVVPFVGAGMSVPSGYPDWQGFLEELLGECGKGGELGDLLDELRLEVLADTLYKHMGATWFNQCVRESFGPHEEVLGPVKLLPAMFNGCVTTNLDRVLEKVYQVEGKSFDHILTGKKCGRLKRVASSADRWLLKLHGDSDRVSDRVFRASEYEEAYKPSFEHSKDLSSLIEYLFSSSTLLFIGCSLGEDRTMEVFRKVTLKLGDDMPQHFALLERPVDVGKRVSRERFLIERGITPVWYAVGKHEYVEAILEHLHREFLEAV